MGSCLVGSCMFSMCISSLIDCGPFASHLDRRLPGLSVISFPCRRYPYRLCVYTMPLRSSRSRQRIIGEAARANVWQMATHFHSTSPPPPPCAPSAANSEVGVRRHRHLSELGLLERSGPRGYNAWTSSLTCFSKLECGFGRRLPFVLNDHVRS